MAGKKKAKVESKLSATEIQTLKDAAYTAFVADSKAYEKENRDHAAAEKTAVECGRAFLKVMENLKRGEFTKWFKRYDASRNRINYCIRVARIADGLPCKATNPPAYKAKMSELQTSLSQLVR